MARSSPRVPETKMKGTSGASSREIFRRGQTVKVWQFVVRKDEVHVAAFERGDENQLDCSRALSRRRSPGVKPEPNQDCIV